MIGVVLGAGRGSRLKPLTHYIPKPLVPLRGKRLIDYSIEGLRRVAEEIVVVTGYLGDMVERYVENRYPNVRVCRNPRVFAGNLTSLLSAGELVRGREFVITNADHIFPPEFFEELVRRKRENRVVLAGHREREIQEDEMKVAVSSGGELYRISKTLRAYDGVYIGACVVPERMSEAFFEVAGKIGNPRSCVEDVFLLVPCVVEWMDEFPLVEIDTWEDLRESYAKVKS